MKTQKQSIKAIETEYKGYRFRSRLEARWAVFFDACGVKWEYEPEGFDLGDGIRYLPDFLLHDVWIRNHTPFDLWVEVKGQMTEDDARKIIKFAGESRYVRNWGTLYEHPILIVSKIPDKDDYWDWNKGIDPTLFFDFAYIDGDYQYDALPCISPQGHFALVGIDYPENIDYKATDEAYRIARQARFEHGERPQVYRQDYRREQDTVTKNVDILTAPDGTNIDVVAVSGYKTKFVKVARVSTAVGYSNPGINENSPLMKAAAWLGLPKYFFKSQRLSGNDSHGKNTYFFAVDDVPRILAQYYEFNCKAKQGTKKYRRAQTAINLRDWFQSTILPRYG